MIRYSLTKNTMNQAVSEYIATVKQSEPTGLDQILDHIITEGSGLTRPQALAYFEKLMQTFEYFIKERGGFNIPLFRVRTTISGVFLDENDTFDPNRHQINLRISPGPRLNKLQKRLKVKKEKKKEITPYPILLTDTNTESINGQVSPGGIATLDGKNLKFNPDDPRQGIFFIPENNPKGKIRVDFYARIRPAEVFFLVPPLQSGNYHIIIQAVMRNHTSIRTGELDSLITVF